jgi:hypothetical protein
MSKCAYDGDIAVAARPTRHYFDSIDKRADGFDNLRACRLVLQRLLKFRDLVAVKLRKIGMDNDPLAVVSGHQISIEVSLASL